MLITIDEYKKFFRNKYSFHFRDCSVIREKVFVFIMEPTLTDEQLREESSNDWDPGLRLKGVFVLNMNAPVGTMWNCQYLNGWKELIAGSSVLPNVQSINIQKTSIYPSFDKKIYVIGGGGAGLEKPLQMISPGDDGGNFLRGAASKIKSIDGHAYVCGGGRSFGRRTGDNSWESLSGFFEIGDDFDSITSSGFSDFDGWSENDIYLVGGLGDAWHFDGKIAKKITFPSSAPLCSVCCGGDGFVYVADLHGDIFQGKNDSWRKIAAVNTTLPIKDMVWHDDVLWCTNDYGIYTMKNGEFQRADLPVGIGNCAGNLYVNHGVLLVAGLGGAAFYSKGQWEVIVDFQKMDLLLSL